jgi:methylenetetrahydrofolate dehydrogenase (NADP+)/methenyltetrahydrofolate cyclohydrolase
VYPLRREALAVEKGGVVIEDEKLLNGTRVATAIRTDVAAEVRALAADGIVPRLDVVLVGDNEASKVYVRSKAKTSVELGMVSHTHELPADTPSAQVEALIDRLNADPEVDGILVQLPLPAGIDSAAMLDRVDPAKDVDGFHPVNVGRLQQNRPSLVPCTPAGIMELLRREAIDIEGKRAVIVGRSDIVGKPMAMLLLHAHATVTLCHSRTRDLAAVTREAEILVVAAGQRSLIGRDHVADGAVVIDVGMHRVTDRAVVEQLYPGNEKKLAAFERRGAVLCGDVDTTRVAPVAGRITPVPGGVGPLTIAMLMSNTARAARLRREAGR